MKITLKSDKDNKLGFVEKYSHYFYEDRRVSVLGMADVGGYFSEPFVLRGDEFIPAAQIDEEMGIAKYLKAKKPFYSVIGTGNIVVSAKIAMTLAKTRCTFRRNPCMVCTSLIRTRLSLSVTASGRLT